MTATPSRRQVLAAAAVVPLAACTEATPPPVNPDDALRDAAVARERGLLAAYDALLATTPALTAKLAGVRAEHEAHLAALGGGTASPVTSRSASPSASTTVMTLAQVAALERAAAAGHAADALTASRVLAPVLASLSASESSHVVALA